MGEVIRFPQNRGDKNNEKEFKTPHIEDGRFYDLQPPANIGGELYDRIQCEYQVPNNPQEYVVQGIPRGETKIKSFVLRFSPNSGVITTEASEQNFDALKTNINDHTDKIN